MYWDMYLFTDDLRTFSVRGNVVATDKGEQHILKEKEPALAVQYNNKYIALGNKPILYNEEAFLPLRNICEYLGYEGLWNSDDIEIRKDGKTVSVKNAVVLDEVSYVSFKALSELIGYEASYNKENKTIYIVQ
jgi:hypothetical protein